MKKTIVTVLVVILLVLALVVAGMLGFLWYRDNHVFVEKTPYPIHAESLDLRENDISFAHYDSLHAKLPECYVLWNVPFQGGKVPSDSASVTVTSLTQEDVDILLEYLPYLQAVDASQCRDYALLEALQEAKPELKVQYTVSLGGQSFAPDTQSLVLNAQDYDYEQLMENLKYLPQVTEIRLRMPQITPEQVEALRAAYGHISITCTIEILGVEYDTETTELDLAELTSAGIAEVADKLVLLPGLNRVSLSSTLSKEDVKSLLDAVPNVVFDYSFEFYGSTISTADEEVIVKNQKIGDENEAEVRLALDLLSNCKRFVLDNCKLSNEVMEKIREDYRDRTKVVWRVWFGDGSSLTDAQILRAVYHLEDDNCHDLYYLEDVRYMDIGHNEWLDACDFVAGMKSLEYVILSGSPIKSLEPFRNCKNLKFLEVAFCEYLKDASALAECTQLEMLNISNTHILDLTPLDNLPMTHLMATTYPSGRARVPAEEQKRYIQQHPDCWTSFDNAHPYAAGWRYDKDGVTALPTYAKLRRVFRYDKDPNIPNHVGWYLQNEEAEPTA